MIYCIGALLVSYLLGSFPTSIVAGKVSKGIDIREYGSGNAGATNTFRVLGWKAGVIVAAVDIVKGFAATYAIPVIALRLYGEPSFFGPSKLLAVLCLCSVVVGHVFPVFAGFKGGKGVGAGAGAVFGLVPQAGLICLTVFILTLVLSGFVSLSSICAAVCLPVSVALLPVLFEIERDPLLLGITVFIALLVVFMHRTNIGRLIQGVERRVEKVRLFKRRRD